MIRMSGAKKLQLRRNSKLRIGSGSSRWGLKHDYQQVMGGLRADFFVG
jgi:hypothetical protein